MGETWVNMDEMWVKYWWDIVETRVEYWKKYGRIINGIRVKHGLKIGGIRMNMDKIYIDGVCVKYKLNICKI